MRAPRPLHAAAGALLLIIPTSAAALAAGQADAQSAIQIDVNSPHVGFGHHVTVTGSAPAQAAGGTIRLEFARAGASRWQPLAATRVGGDGRFRFVTAVRRSGRVRAVPAGDPPAPRPGVPVVDATTSTGVAAPALGPSAPRPIAVGSKLAVRQRSITALDGQAVNVAGHLLPAARGRSVRLEGRSGGRWHLLATDRTGSRGGFNIRYRPGMTGPGGQSLRVRFRGDRLNSPSLRSAGRETTFTESLASWYYDAGNTACGFHAGLGVANRSLPCGSKVTFRFGGRTVTATVDDRGPYVGGREWDLNQNTAGALGFGGVGTVLATS